MVIFKPKPNGFFHIESPRKHPFSENSACQGHKTGSGTMGQNPPFAVQ